MTNYIRKNISVFFDIDGVFTDGRFYYDTRGKALKSFGPDDWDCLRELRKYVNSVHFLTADKKGYNIVLKRFNDFDPGVIVNVVTNKPYQRYEWIKKINYNKKIYVADGVYDYCALRSLDYGITTSHALKHVQESADYVIDRKGGERFVAEACLHILEKFYNFNVLQVGWDD